MQFFSSSAWIRRFVMGVPGAVLLGVLLLGAGVTVRAQSPAASGSTATDSAAKPQTVVNETDAYRMSPAVVKIGAMLGMKPETAANVFTIFNIVVLFGAIGYGLMKALPKIFRDRSSKIQKSLVDARSATEEATSRLGAVEQRLAKLDEQIAAMRAQAEAEGLRDEQRIKASVKDEKVKIVAAAEAEIATATALARREIQKYAAELAIEQAVRKLEVSADTDRMLVENFAQRLGSGFEAGGSKN
jgi:F-type H+-transporting ATPase subunit b